MPAGLPIATARLVLRQWTDADAEPFAAINTDPRVMEFYARPLDRAESDAFLARNRDFIARHGYGLYAVDEKATGSFVGYVGLAEVPPHLPFAPATEVGWRLARRAWGSGYATEAARAVVADALGRLGLPALVSFTAEWNRPSRRVMEKLGMTHDPAEDFRHPKLPPDHKLSPHVLYRIDKTRWQAMQRAE